MITVVKRFEFCYGHNLPDYAGLCRNLHGHNAVVEVEVGKFLDVKGGGNEYPGMVIDFSILKKIVAPILEKLDHQLLNIVLPAEYLPPTAENIVMWLAEQIKEGLREWEGRELVRVSVSETPNSWAIWKA